MSKNVLHNFYQGRSHCSSGNARSIENCFTHFPGLRPGNGTKLKQLSKALYEIVQNIFIIFHSLHSPARLSFVFAWKIRGGWRYG